MDSDTRISYFEQNPRVAINILSELKLIWNMSEIYNSGLDNNLNSSPSIIRKIKSRRMRWAGHVGRMEVKNVYRLLVGKPQGKNQWEDQDVSGWIILGWIVERWEGVMWTGLVWLRIGTGKELNWAVVNSVLNLRVP
jgi:hypothetical protein